jgi:hypothetical protein
LSRTASGLIADQFIKLAALAKDNVWRSGGRK